MPVRDAAVRREIRGCGGRGHTHPCATTEARIDSWRFKGRNDARSADPPEDFGQARFWLEYAFRASAPGVAPTQ